MNIVILTDFFKYCTIINFVFLLLSTIMMRTDLPYNLHTKFGIWMGSKESHKQLMYSLLGHYKILITILNLVPYFVLCCCV